MSATRSESAAASNYDREVGEILVHNMGDLDDRSTSSNAPEMVAADMDGGLETVSVKLAEAFYKRYGSTLHGMTKRGQLSQFYIDTYESWCPEELRGQPRHFKQVLYALVNDGKVVRVVGGGRFLRWAYASTRRRHDDRRSDRRHDDRRDSRRSDDRRSDRRDEDGFQRAGRRGRRDNSSHRFNDRRGNSYRSDNRRHISDELVDRIAARLAERDDRR